MRRPITTLNNLNPSPVEEELSEVRRGTTRSRRTAIFWVRAWFPVLLALAVIATESTKYFGADQTSGPLRAVYEALFGPVANAAWTEIHHYIRKTGHFIGYGIVGLTLLRAWWLTLPGFSFYRNALLALLGTALIASSDEIHQTFLPNRTGMASDVLIDCMGALTQLLLVYVILRLFRPKTLETREA